MKHRNFTCPHPNKIHTTIEKKLEEFMLIFVKKGFGEHHPIYDQRIELVQDLVHGVITIMKVHVKKPLKNCDFFFQLLAIKYEYFLTKTLRPRRRPSLPSRKPTLENTNQGIATTTRLAMTSRRQRPKKRTKAWQKERFRLSGLQSEKPMVIAVM